jgi:hypothetical protein
MRRAAVARTSRTPSQQVLKANAARLRRAATKHEQQAADQRRRADRIDAEYDRWRLELEQRQQVAS